jgi:hypothetical protein
MMIFKIDNGIKTSILNASTVSESWNSPSYPHVEKDEKHNLANKAAIHKLAIFTPSFQQPKPFQDSSKEPLK